MGTERHLLSHLFGGEEHCCFRLREAAKAAVWSTHCYEQTSHHAVGEAMHEVVHAASAVYLAFAVSRIEENDRECDIGGQNSREEKTLKWERKDDGEQLIIVRDEEDRCSDSGSNHRGTKDSRL